MKKDPKNTLCGINFLTHAHTVDTIFLKVRGLYRGPHSGCMDQLV